MVEMPAVVSGRAAMSAEEQDVFDDYAGALGDLMGNDGNAIRMLTTGE